MKRYLYETTVNTVSGIQIWYIDAETKEEADEMADKVLYVLDYYNGRKEDE